MWEFVPIGPDNGTAVVDLGHVYIIAPAQSTSLGDPHFIIGRYYSELFRYELRQVLHERGPQTGLVPDDLCAYDLIAWAGAVVLRTVRSVVGVR